MAVHRPLGLAGGAGGVDQNRQVLRPASVDPLHQCIGMRRVVLASQRTQALEAEHVGVVQVAQALHVEHHDLLQAWQLPADFQRLVQLFVVFHEQQAGARVVA